MEQHAVEQRKATDTILVVTPVVTINDVIADEVHRAGYTPESTTDHAKVCDDLQFGFHPIAIIVGHSFTRDKNEGEVIIRRYKEHTPHGAVLVYTDQSNIATLRAQQREYGGEFTIALNHPPDGDCPSPLDVLRGFLSQLQK